MMWVSHNIVLLFLAWTIEVLTFRQSEGIGTNDHSVIHTRQNKAISEDTWKWHRSYGRKIDGKGYARGYARGLTLPDGVNTSINNKSGKFKMRRITTGGLERVGYQDYDLPNSEGTGTANSAATKIGESHKKFYSKKPAAMETAGGRYYSSKPHVMTKRNSRRKRDAIYNQNRAVKSEQKGSNKIDPSSLLETFLGSPQTIWEPMPRPLALNQSTDFPFDMTRHFFTFLPDDDLEETTPLIPLRTRGKNNLMNNPFYPVTSESYGAYAVMCVSVMIFTVGIIGNISILCIVCHNYYMRSISNSLLANLALWDFVIVFFCLPLVTFHELTKTWLLGEFSCKIIPYLEVASLGVTTFTLCALCIDRFRAATNVQMYYEMIENCASTSAKLAVIWVGALLLALPELLLRELEVEDGEPSEGSRRERCVVRVSTLLPDTLYVLGLTYDSARLWWYFGCFFCLPTLFTIGSSLATARKIRQAERASVRGNKKQIRLESQMNCTVVALAILYGLCIVPENICNIVTAYMAAGVPRRSMELLHLVSQLLLFCKSAVTPVLLLCLCRPFSRAFLDCCCCCCAGCGPARSADDVDHECTTELELSPFSTICREMSTYTSVGTHC